MSASLIFVTQFKQKLNLLRPLDISKVQLHVQISHVLCRVTAQCNCCHRISDGVICKPCISDDINYKFRWMHIISCCGTATENVAKWIEVHLKHLVKIHPTYIEDTIHFLEKIEKINETYAPVPPSTLLITWGIQNFYPSCNTQKVIEATKKRYNWRAGIRKYNKYFWSSFVNAV